MLNFPSSPTNGQTITINGIVYIYSEAKNYWLASGVLLAGGTPASLTEINIDKINLMGY